MGCCFSKKKPNSPPQPPPPPKPQPQAVTLSSAIPPLAAETTLKAVTEPKIQQVIEEEQFGKASQEESLVKKEIFVIRHRKSHDRDKRSPPPLNPPQSTKNECASSASTEGGVCNINTTAVRTSSCTKEEVDAILIQCGRLSRSNSSGKTPSSRKYSGSKRSYDFDCENDNDIGSGTATTDNGSRKKGNDGSREDDDRPRRRPSSRSSSHGRRRTPSRERDQQQQRSGSRERGSGVGSSGGGRRVSRSPGRRSENSEGSTVGSNAAATGTNRPGKMVSVPATVSSLVMDKSINGVETATTTVKRISVKRNVGESPARTAASPRSQSPARTNPNTNNAKGCNNNENQQQQPTLSRSSSRKAEHSPYRRNPLSEIDPNSLAYPHSAANKGQQGGIKKSNVEMNHKAKAKEPIMVEDAKTQPVKAGADNVKPQQLTRSRSSRRSRDLDLNPETLLNPIPSSYTTLLLEDIQNFHQNNNPPPPISGSLPACVRKACSIMEAVADLNSTTSSNLSDRKGLPTDDSNKNHFVETEVIGSDHLMEPSFHKYVTVRRDGGGGGADMEDQESSGSNSIIVGSGQQHRGLSSSSWEPNSADSTDRWTSRTKSDYNTPLGLQRHAFVEPGNDIKR